MTTLAEVCSFRDSYYRSLVEYEAEYDACIDILMAISSKTEEFCCNAIHMCISWVLFGNHGQHVSTGGVMCSRLTSNEKSPGYRKVKLSIDLLSMRREVILKHAEAHKRLSQLESLGVIIHPISDSKV